MIDDAMRASDAERDRAADLLGEHFAAGRLDASEWRERLDAVHAARTLSEVEAPFADLPAAVGQVPGQALSQVSGQAPGQAPGSPRGSTPASAKRNDVVRVAGAAAVVAAVVLLVVAVGWAAWPAFMLVGVVGRTCAYGGPRGGRARRLGPRSGRYL